MTRFGRTLRYVAGAITAVGGYLAGRAIYRRAAERRLTRSERKAARKALIAQTAGRRHRVA
jgi:cystathionine beta-lyase family protein involved in aluminum resistance